VLGIARGGVLVAAPIAHALRAPLDVCVVRKVGHPGQPELALGAVSAAGDVVVTEYARELAPADLQARIDDAAGRARDLQTQLREGRPPLDIRERTVVLIDDGIATSATMLCAIAYARRFEARRVVCAVPVAPADYLERFGAACDRLLVLQPARERQFAVGRYYEDFHEVSDEEVRAALRLEGATP
jgi:putative phosphoribosyl transferase